ncbi:hypothetical protein RI129_005840 [Pyrocoelia pectoralis]|uniref:Lipase domain-containing protein n=1 Tax=Pyrocoelia pectoralis TaxID=417401 RepID=A0AAN7ZFP5_9COLE
MYSRSGSISLYANAYCNLPPVSANVALFLCKLCTSNGVKSDNIHIIGHSLGAQVGGIAGRNFQQNCNATIGRITGLDAANPGFICPLCNNFRLDWNDAKFVDIIHTDVFLFGTPLKSGDIDFFVNHGGPFQPGCFDYTNETVVSLLEDPLLILLMPVACSHQRSCYFFAESIILNDFYATSCSLAGNVPLQCLYIDRVYMGEYCKKRQAYDIYGVSVKAEFPYGYGPRGPLY